MEKFRLTLNILDNAQPGIILATGVTIDNPDGLHISGSGKELRWVLKLGGINDWCIYTHWATNSIEYVRDHGDKVTQKSNILNIIDIDDEKVWKRMRY